MTYNQCKEYHTTLWGNIVQEVERLVVENKPLIGSINNLKSKLIKKMIEENKNIEIPFNDCFLCEYYEKCEDCPLGGVKDWCYSYYNFCECVYNKEYDEAIEIAKEIRDVFRGSCV